MKLSKLLLGLGAAALAFAMQTAGAEALDDVVKAGVLKVAVPQDFPPFGSVNAEMKPQGLDIDVAALIARKMGVKLELVPVTSTNRVPYLQTRKVDLVISSMGKNAEREKAIDFSEAYAPFYIGIRGHGDHAQCGILARGQAGEDVGLIHDGCLMRLDGLGRGRAGCGGVILPPRGPGVAALP